MEGHAMMDHSMMDHSKMDHSMNHDMMTTHEMSSCAMNMLFNWGIKDVCVVFEFWHIQTVAGMLISCIAVFMITAGYEYLRVLSNSIENKWLEESNKRKVSEDDGYETLTPAEPNSFSRKDIKVVRPLFRYRLLNAINYTVLVAISFWLMLVFMTYNGFLMLSIIFGAGFGHLIFGNGKLRASRDIQCH